MLTSRVASGHERAFTVPSPMVRSSTSYAEQRAGLHSASRSRPQVGAHASSIISQGNKMEGEASIMFKHVDDVTGGNQMPRGLRLHSKERPAEPITGNISPSLRGNTIDAEPMDPCTRTLYPVKIGGTPRSSAEFYTMSNNSIETLISEYANHEKSHIQARPGHHRHGSYIEGPQSPKADLLMIGYAQIIGSYTLDGSLINQTPFEQAKKKGIIGGHGGGGVVRSESTKRDSGILGSLGWGNIGESLGGFLGASEMSSIKEGKGTENAKAVPILSTPQAVLFVDLRLQPGESKSFTYKYPLPKGIPPSHKGRAIRISYNLVVGTQRTATRLPQQQIQHAEVPFRVLTSVTGEFVTLRVFPLS